MNKLTIVCDNCQKESTQYAPELESWWLLEETRRIPTVSFPSVKVSPWKGSDTAGYPLHACSVDCVMSLLSGFIQAHNKARDISTKALQRANAEEPQPANESPAEPQRLK